MARAPNQRPLIDRGPQPTNLCSFQAATFINFRVTGRASIFLLRCFSSRCRIFGRVFVFLNLIRALLFAYLTYFLHISGHSFVSMFCVFAYFFRLEGFDSLEFMSCVR